MNKKVLATAGIAALAVSATVAKADEVTTNGSSLNNSISIINSYTSCPNSSPSRNG